MLIINRAMLKTNLACQANYFTSPGYRIFFYLAAKPNKYKHE